METIAIVDSKKKISVNNNIATVTPINAEQSSNILAHVKSLTEAVAMVPRSLYDDVYITPNYLEFNEASEGLTSRRNIVIQNCGTKPAFIRIREPNSIAFQVKALKAGTMLSPGLSVSTSVVYCFRRPALLRAIIPIEINDKILDYCVICTLATERIKIEPKSIDFGTIDIGYMADAKFISIYNDGGKSTRFSVDLAKNDLDITVKPLRGIVRPYKTVKLKIEVIGTREGMFFSEFWIKSSPNIRVPLRVNVITHQLMIYHPNTTGDFALIDFPPTVENTRKYNTFVLRNISSRACNYIVLGEVNNETKSIRNIDCRKHPVYEAFEIDPIEGYLSPFEGIIFKIGFHPTMQLLKHQKTIYKDMMNKENDFMAFITIIKVHCAEVGSHYIPETSVDEVVPEKVHMQETLMDLSSSSSSSDTIVQLDDNNVVRICLYGEMEVVKLGIEPDVLYFDNLYVGETSQRVICITNLSSIEPVTFQCVPKAAVQFYPKKAKLKPNGSIEVLVKVQARENVGPTFEIAIDAIVDSEDPALTSRLMKVKIGTFTVACTMNVFLKSKRPKPCRLRYIMDHVDSDSDQNKVTISKEIILKRSWSINKDDNDNFENISRIMRYPKRCTELPKILRCEKLFDKKLSICEIKAGVLIPLTPLQIYNIHVYPGTIDFGMVALKTPNYRQLFVENRNEFAIQIQFLSTLRNLRFPDGDTMLLHPEKTMVKLIEFYGGSMGKFNGFINYNINGNHSFELSVVAEIVQKDLSVDKREIIIGKDYLSEESNRPLWSIVQIRNKLDAATRYKWKVPANSCFSIEPKYGTIRGNSTLNAVVSYNADLLKVPFAEISIKCESGSYSTLRCNLAPSMPKVVFVNDQVDLGELSLNLPSRVSGILQSFEYTEVMFEIDVTSLLYGCEIYPLRGKIPPRGIAILEATFKFDICIEFAITVFIMIQNQTRLQWKINGRVPFPRLKFTPQSIEQRRVIVGTFQSHLITVTNIGATTSKLQFVLQEYPEFNVSIVPKKKGNIVVEDETSVIIPPGSSRSFHLRFQPFDAASYAFYLPIIINDILGPISDTDSKTLKPREYLSSHEEFYKDNPGITLLELPPKLPFVSIDFTVAGHIVLFNKFEFNFDAATDNILDELHIQNPNTLGGVTLIIKIDGFTDEDCPFSICWSRGVQPTITPVSIMFTLFRGEETVFVIEFDPKYQGTFKLEAPILVRRDTGEIPFNTIHISGVKPEKLLETDYTEVYFLPVPLNNTIDESFKLRAQHFNYTSKVTWDILPPDRCTGDFKKEMLHIIFPYGNTITTAPYVEIDVKITFRSDRVTSFCAKIEFHDEQCLVVCPVTVYAAADNNLLTTHAYFTTSFDYHRRSHYEDRQVSVLVTDEKHSGTDSEGEDYDHDNHHERNSMPLFIKSLISTGSGKKYENGDSDDMNDIDTIQDEEFSRRESHFLKGLSNSLLDMPAENHRLSSRIMYPYFPMDEDIMNNYGQHMHRALLCAEQWLYANVFKYNFYPNVLAGITASYSIIIKTKARHSNAKIKTRSLGKSFIDVLESLAGPRIYEYLERLSLPTDDIQRIDLILRQYEKMLDFLIQEGACLAHVLVHFLLNYNDYIVFMDPQQFTSRKKKLGSTHFIELSKSLFESRSKQCWLDVILQTYKCFKFNDINEVQYRRRLTICSMVSSRRSTFFREASPSNASFRRISDFYDKSIEGVRELFYERMKESDNSGGELLLLSWLQYHYETERTKNWLANKKITLNSGEEETMPCQKKIDNFNFVLSDGLILIAVTGSYCPFLINECFSNLYINPKNIEEEFHNASCLVTAWTKIRLGFVVTPSQIVHPNSIQMLMLVVHLFESLPGYVPKYKIKFNCPLTKTAVRQVTFTNSTENPVEYLLYFIDNDNGFFSLMQEQSRIRINAHDGVQVKICFHGKKIKKTKAFLLMCGSAYGPHFGNNQTYILEGTVNSLEVSQECEVQSKLYNILDTTLSIKVPYPNLVEYEIWMAEEQPNKLANLKMTKWSELRTRTVPRRLFLNQKSITVDCEGTMEAKLSLTVACITPNSKKFWLICQSKSGDFIIQIISRCKASLTDRIIVRWSEGYKECTCPSVPDSNEDCPHNVNIFIPSRNKKLWNCVNHMFQKTLDAKERLFWSRYLDTYIGLRLIHWLMGRHVDSAALEFMHIFNAAVTYSVSTADKDGNFTVPNKFVINDVRLENNYVPLKVHLCSTISKIHETTVSLTSEDGKELRIYAVSFLHIERPSDDDEEMSLDAHERNKEGVN